MGWAGCKCPFLEEVLARSELSASSVCAASILRLVLVHGAAKAGKVTRRSALLFVSDVTKLITGSGTYAVLLSAIEVNVAIICASLMVMKPLFVCLFPGLAKSSRAQKSDALVPKMASSGTWPSVSRSGSEGSDNGSQQPLKNRLDSRGSSNVPVEMQNKSYKGG